MRLIICLLFIFFTSCSSHLFYKIYYNSKTPLKDKIIFTRDDGREIIFIPMIHLAKQEYYDQVKEFVLEKRKQGYIIYYEGVQQGHLSSQELDTLNLKIRKILGFHLTNYADVSNKSLPNWFKKYVGQTRENTGIDTIIDVNADMSWQELIEKIERDKGKIILEECDFLTPLTAKYKCNNYRDKYYYLVTRTYRDAHLDSLLSNSYHKKIVLLYGKSHKWSICPDLGTFVKCLVLRQN